MQQLSEGEWTYLRDRFLGWLNHFPGSEYLAGDYFPSHEVHADVLTFHGRFLTVDFHTDDDGGPTTLFFHMPEPDDFREVEFATHTFDTVTSVWISNYQEVKA